MGGVVSSTCVADFLVAMEQWSGEHRAFAIEAYMSNEFSLSQARRRFNHRYGIRRLRDGPSINLIQSWVARFRATGSTINRPKPGPTPAVATDENIERVMISVAENPRLSLRARSSILGIKKSTLQVIMRKKLKFHPYKIQIAQDLQESDFELRKTYAEMMLSRFRTATRMGNIFFSDEAHFHIGGYVNKQNFRYWDVQNPRQLHQEPLHKPKVTVWCAISASAIIGPYFFENQRGQTVTVNSERYAQMLHDFFRLELQISSCFNRNTWFQQDGATAHTANVSMQAVRQLFPKKNISRNGTIPWLLRSPDLSPCDFFLWGYLKSLVYKTNPSTLPQLKENIRSEVNKIPQTLCKHVFENMRARLEECVSLDGRHLQNVVFKK